jgi:hypothetical protein
VGAIRLIHCQSGNPRSARLAVEHGWWYGFRSDCNHYARELGPVALLDCRWEKPDWPKHLGRVAELCPWLAIVPDTMRLDELDRTLWQAEEIARYATPLVVPKCFGLIECLPRTLCGRSVVLGYSLPTAYGGTELPLWEYRDWPVHILGGNPRRQAECAAYLPHVVSADGNLTWRLARRGIVVTSQGKHGSTIAKLDGQSWPGENMPLEAFRRSLCNLRRFWDCVRADVEWRAP